MLLRSFPSSFLPYFLLFFQVVLTSLNVHRLVITSLMLAAKFFDDLFYNNAFYAKLGGVNATEMNTLEVIIIDTYIFTTLIVI